jgi:shikimate kinase
MAALREALAGGPCILATGGGIVLRAENRALLRERAFVAWLDAPIEALVARLRAHAEVRPLLEGDDPAARLTALRATRAALYAQVADVRVDTGGLTAEQVCEQVLSTIKDLSHRDHRAHRG